MNKSEEVLILLGAFLLVIIVTIIFAYPVMLLWNWLCPYLFGLPTMTFWQTLGFTLMIRLIIPSKTTTNSNK